MTSRQKDEVLAFAKSTVEQAIALREQAVELRARSTQGASNRAEARILREHRRELCWVSRLPRGSKMPQAGPGLFRRISVADEAEHDEGG